MKKRKIRNKIRQIACLKLKYQRCGAIPSAFIRHSSPNPLKRLG
jgi:hypothetical protein